MTKNGICEIYIYVYLKVVELKIKGQHETKLLNEWKKLCLTRTEMFVLQYYDINKVAFMSYTIKFHCQMRSVEQEFASKTSFDWLGLHMYR